MSVNDICGKVICGDAFAVAEQLPKRFVDLLILDPPYNLDKNYNGLFFKEKTPADYRRWFQQAVDSVMPTLKPTATVYVCADWKTSVLIAPVLEACFHVRNRIYMGTGQRSRCERQLEG